MNRFPIALPLAGLLLCCAALPVAAAPKGKPKAAKAANAAKRARGTAPKKDGKKPKQEAALKLPPAPGASVLSFAPGSALVRNGKKVGRVQKGTALKQGDVLKAGKGDLDARIGDQATVRLKPGASLTLKTLLRRSKNDPQTVDNRFRAQSGTVLVKLRALRGKSRFIVDSPSAVTAARGTAYLVQVSGQETRVIVEEGRVSVGLPARPDEGVEVGPEQQIQVRETLPRQPRPLEDAEKHRLDELRRLVLAVDRESESLVRRIDLLMAARRYGEAERLAEYVVGRAWGRRNAVRAHARLAECLQRRTGTAYPYGETPDLGPTVQAWIAASRELAGVPDLAGAVGRELQDDPVARRRALIGLAVATANGNSIAGAVEKLSQMRARVDDPVVRSACAFFAGVTAFDRRDPSRTPEVMQQATALFEEVVRDPAADEVHRMQALERLTLWPDSLSSRKQKPKPNLEVLASMARRARHAWGYYLAAGALAKLGRPDEAAEYVDLFFSEPVVRGKDGKFHGFIFGVVAELASAYRGAGNAPGEVRALRFLLGSFAGLPEHVRNDAERRLAELQ